MQCQVCQNTEATVHLAQVVAGELTTWNSCPQCAEDLGVMQAGQVGTGWTNCHPDMMVIGNQADLTCLLGKKPCYPKAAYEFVRMALSRATDEKQERRNRTNFEEVTAAELLIVIRTMALESFGAKARSQLQKWNIHRTEDFGELVFDLVDVGWVGKSTSDQKEDFANGYAFSEAFPEE